MSSSTAVLISPWSPELQLHQICKTDIENTLYKRIESRQQKAIDSSILTVIVNEAYASANHKTTHKTKGPDLSVNPDDLNRIKESIPQGYEEPASTYLTTVDHSIPSEVEISEKTTTVTAKKYTFEIIFPNKSSDGAKEDCINLMIKNIAKKIRSLGAIYFTTSITEFPTTLGGVSLTVRSEMVKTCTRMSTRMNFKNDSETGLTMTIQTTGETSTNTCKAFEKRLELLR